MRITRTLAVFFVVPVAVQGLLVASMFVCFKDFGETLKEQIECKEIQAFLDQAQRLQTSSVGCAFIASITGYERVKKQHTEGIEKLKGLLPRLRRIQKSHPELLVAIDDFIAKEKELVKLELAIRNFPLLQAIPALRNSAEVSLTVKTAMSSIRTVIAKVEDMSAALQSNQSHALETGAIASALILLFELALAVNWSRRTFDSRLQAVFNRIAEFKQGKPLEHPVYSGDELIRLEDAIVTADEKLRELEDTRRELSSIVAHDLRAPLTSIAGSLELMEETGMFGTLPTESRTTIAEARKGAEQLIFAVNLLLEFARLKSTDRLNVEKISNQRLEDTIFEELDNAGLSGLRNFTCKIDESSGALPIVPLSKTVAFLIKSLPAHEHIELQVRNTDNGTFARLELRGKSGTGTDNGGLKMASVMAGFLGATATQDSDENGTAIEFLFKKEAENTTYPSVASKRRSYRSTFLLLLGATIMLNLLTATSLVRAWHEGQLQLDKERESRNIVHAASTVTSDATEIMILAVLQAPDIDAEMQRVQRTIDQSVNRLGSLEQAVPESKRAAIERWKAKIRAIQEASRRIAAVNKEDPYGMAPYVKQLVDNENLEQTLFSHSGKFIVDQERASSSASERMWQLLQSLSAQITWISLGGTAASIACAFLLARHLIARLENVEMNAMLLQKGAKLRPPFKGNDEIAALDQFFYDAASTLNRMERERQALVMLLRDELYIPISQLKSSVTMLLLNQPSQAPLPDKVLKQLEVVNAELSRLSLLIDDLQCADLLGSENTSALMISPTEASLLTVVDSAIMATSHQAQQKKIRVETRSTISEEAKVFIDPQRTVQVLVNLLTNAIKVSPKEGAILINVEPVRMSVKVSITDHGRGISGEQKKLLFKRFSRLREETGSTGLGLFIVKRLVELQGGTIGLESEPGKGSTFWITFPIANEKR